MLTLPSPKDENEIVYRHALAEIERLWDTSHDSDEFIYLLDWISDYEDVHYPMDEPTEPYVDDANAVVLQKLSDAEENLIPTQFAIDVSGLSDFSWSEDIEDFSYRVIVNGYSGEESGKRYYPARAMRFVSLLNRTLENRLLDFIERRVREC